MTLTHAPIDAACEITRVCDTDSAAIRLMELGLIEGTRVRVMRRAPLGDPIQVRLFEEYDLTIRRSDADLMTVCTIAE